MEGLKLIPYVSVDGINTLRDSEIKECFKLMIRDGSAFDIFYDDSVLTAEGFLHFVKTTVSLFIRVEYQDEFFGLIWLTPIATKVYSAHFWVAPPARRHGKIYEICREVLNEILNMRVSPTGEYYCNLLIGFVPKFNTKAIKFVRLLQPKVMYGWLPSFAYVPTAEPAAFPVRMFYWMREKNENLQQDSDQS